MAFFSCRKLSLTAVTRMADSGRKQTFREMSAIGRKRTFAAPRNRYLLDVVMGKA